MKKRALLLFVILSITVLSSSMSEGVEFAASSPVTADLMIVLSKSSLNGFDHAVITFNDVDQTAFAVVLDPNGVPDPFYLGYAYLFADYLTHKLYGSNNGFDWFIIGSI